jgi:hypothetical protein
MPGSPTTPGLCTLPALRPHPHGGHRRLGVVTPRTRTRVSGDARVHTAGVTGLAPTRGLRNSLRRRCRPISGR